MATNDKREEMLATFFKDPEAVARFIFTELPAFFQAKHETAMKELDKALAAMAQKIQNDRLELENAHPATLRQYLSELEAHLQGWLKGSGPQDSRHFGALAKETCQKLCEANQEAVLKDSDFRRLEQFLKTASESVGKQIAKKEVDFVADIYRQIALQLNEKHSKILSFQQKPYEVKLRDGEIAERPVSLAREDGAWIGNNWIVPQAIKGTELFFPPEEITFPVGIVYPYQTPGWLTYGPKGISAKKAAAVLSNVLFQRLLSGLPNIKVAIFDSGRSDIKDYEHDLTQDLPADPEVHEKLLKKFMDFGEFKSCMEKWLGQQPENYKNSRNNKSGNKRLFQLYAILILPDDPTEYEHEAYREWMKWWMRLASKGVGLFVVSTDNVFKTTQEVGIIDGLTHLSFDNTGKSLSICAGGDSWKVLKTTLNPSWAENDEDWNMGRQVLQKLIRPPQKEEPGVVSVRFADEENGEAFNLRYSSQSANTIFIHGKQGSGKSVALVSFILRAARKYSPEELAFYIFDNKNTFSPLRELKHVACLTISSNEEIMLGVLDDINEQRKERQELFRRVGTKFRKTCENLDDYNRFRVEHPQEGLPSLPRILVVVDECKNMLNPSQERRKNIEELLDKYLLSQGRSAGIHFLFATTEDIRSDVGKGKFDATLQISRPIPTVKRFIATLTEGENERMLVMPTISDDEIANKYQAIDEVNLLYKDCLPVISPLFFDAGKEKGVDAADYVPFTEEIRKLATPEKNVFRCSAGIDTQKLRQLQTVSFQQGRSGQALSIFGRWNSPYFMGGMELFLRTLEFAVRNGCIKVDVLDCARRWPGRAVVFSGDFKIWTDVNEFLEVKRRWLRTALGQEVGARVLVAFDAEETLQGESARTRQNSAGRTDSRKISGAALRAFALDDDGGGEDMMPSRGLPPEEVDRLFKDGAILKESSSRGAFLVAVTEKPRTFCDCVTSYDFCRFLVYDTRQVLSDLDNAPAQNLGYFADSPRDTPQYFLPFDQTGITETIAKALKLQKGLKTP